MPEQVRIGAGAGKEAQDDQPRKQRQQAITGRDSQFRHPLHSATRH